MAYTIVNVVGFDTGDDSEKIGSSSGTPTFSSSITHVGSGYSIASLLTDSLWRRRYYGGVDTVSTHMGVGFAIYVTHSNFGGGGAFANPLKGFVSATNYEISLFLQPGTDANNFQIFLQDDNINFSSNSGDLAHDQWHWVELYWEHDVSGADAFLYVDGVEEISWTNQDFDGSFGSTITYELEGGADGYQYYIDSFYAANELTDKTDLLGEHGVFPHYADETTATPDFAGPTNGPTALVTGTWDDTATISEVATVSYTADASGGADGIALDSGISGNPLLLKAIWWAKTTLTGRSVDHFGVWGNSVDGRTATDDLALADAYGYRTRSTTSASIVPTTAQDLHLGFELDNASAAPTIRYERSSLQQGGTTISTGTLTTQPDEGNVMLVVIVKDDDTATTNSPAGWTRFLEYESNNAIYIECWSKTAVNNESSSFQWIGDSETYLIQYFEFQGAAAVSSLITNVGTDAVPFTASTTATNANSMIIAGFGIDGGGSAPRTIDAVLTSVHNGATGTGAGDVALSMGYYTPGSTSIPQMDHTSSEANQWGAFTLEVTPAAAVKPLHVAWMMGCLFAPYGGAGGVIHEAGATATAIADVTATGTALGIKLADATATAIADITATGSQFGNILADATATAIADVSTATGTVIAGVVDLRLSAFQFRKHFGQDGQHRPMQPISTNIDAIEDKDYALRLLVENQGAKDAAIQGFDLEYRKNTGTWTQVTTTSADVQANQDPVRFVSSPAFIGDVYADNFHNYVTEFIEAPAGTFHKVTFEMDNGICGSQNLYHCRYQRSTNNGLSWTNAYDLKGLGWSHADSDCIQSRLYKLLTTKDGSDMYLAYYDTVNDATAGTLGVTNRSTDYGVTWGTQHPMDDSASQPKHVNGVASLSDYIRFVLQEDGTLYRFVAGGSAVYNGPVLPENIESQYILCQYKSTNQGNTWTYSAIVDDYKATSGDIKTWQLYDAGVDRTTGDLYLLMRDGDDMQLYKSTDDGANWTADFSTLWNFTSSDATYAWPYIDGYHLKQCLHVSNKGRLVVNYAKKATNGYNILLKISDDGGTTWSEVQIGFDTAYGINANTHAYVTSRLQDTDEHTELFLLTPGITYNLPFDEVGPTWWESEDCAVWTGPHTTRMADEGTFWDDLYNVDNGYLYTGNHFQTKCTILPLGDQWGNVHLMWAMEVENGTNDGNKAHYDATPRYRNLQHSAVNELEGQSNLGFDTTNHCYSLDGTMGPARLRGQTKVEFDIKLRPVGTAVVATDTLEFRINGINNDVVPTMTIATTEKVWPGTTGTIVTAGAKAHCLASTTATASPSYKAAVAPSLPHLINANALIVPKGRKTGPFYNYTNDKYYVLAYGTGPTSVQFWTVTTNRDGTWATVGSAININAADSVWVEQGIGAYYDMLYLVIQDDTNGDVDFYELDTTAGTLSTVVNLHSPSPTPLRPCVSVAIRMNGTTPQIVVAYSAQRDGTYGTERCNISIRDCGGSTWTHNITADGRAGAALTHWMTPTVVAGSNGLVHIFVQTGPVDVNYTDSIWAHTLRLDNTTSTMQGISSLTATASGLNSDLEPPGQAVAWFRAEDATEVRLAFCYQDTAEIDALSCYEGAGGDILFRSPNVLTIVPNDAQDFKDGTNDTANMVMLAEDGDTDPLLTHRFFYVTDTWEAVYSAYDESSYLFAGYSSVANIVSLPSVSRVQKISANYIYPGGGGVYVGMIYEEPAGLYYDEMEIIPSADQGPVTHNADATSTAKGVVLNAVGTKGYTTGATAAAIADVSTAAGTVVLYDPVKLAGATATGVADIAADPHAIFVSTATAAAIGKVIQARGGKPFVGSATSTAAATAYASPTIITEALSVDSPINVLVVRDGDGVEESVQNDLITSVVVAIEQGRNIIDEHGQSVKEMSLTVLYQNNFRAGQLIHVQDALRGLLHVGKITAVSHNRPAHADAAVTSLEIRVPIDASLTRKPTFELVTVAAQVIIDGQPATIEFTVDTGGQIIAQPATITINGVDAQISAGLNTLVTTTPATITATGATANIQADTRIDTTPATVTMSGADATIQSDTNIDTSAAGLTVTGEDAAVQADTNVAATPASMTVTGSDAEIQEDTSILTTPATITATGADATIAAATSITTIPATITLTGVDAQITEGSNTNVTTTPATITFTGSNAIISEDREIDTTPATVTLTGQDATIQEDTGIVTTPATITLSGPTGTIQTDTAVITTAANITLAGQDATIEENSGPTDVTTTPATVTFTAVDPTIFRGNNTNINAVAANITLTGQDATVQVETVIQTTASSITITGVTATINAETDVDSTPATITFTPVDPSITRT